MQAVPHEIKEQSQAGFTVIEALIAMAILASALLPLLAVQGQMTKSATQISRIEVQTLNTQNAVATLSQRNFARADRGVETLGAVVLHWRARPNGPAARTLGANGEVGRYQVQPFLVEVEIRENDSPLQKFTFQGLGWRPLWSPTAGF